MSELTQHVENVRREWQKLQSVWEDTRTKWRDDVADDFQKQQWQPLEVQVGIYIKVLEETCMGVSRTPETWC